MPATTLLLCFYHKDTETFRPMNLLEIFTQWSLSPKI